MELSPLAGIGIGRDPAAAMSAANAALAVGDAEAIRKSSVEFESVFLSAMLAPMARSRGSGHATGGFVA